MPASESTYNVRLKHSSYVTAFSGTFLADPETDDLVRLTIATGELPLAAETCQITATLNYAMVRIGDFRFLLPTHVRQRWVDPNGFEAENNTAFTACREYTGESTITFAPESAANPGGPVTSPQAVSPSVPAGLRFAMALTSPIATDTAAAGDPFSARLTEPLRARLKVFAPKGALVEGHLVRVETFHHPPSVVVVFRPETVEVRGSKVPLAASRDWQREVTESRAARRRGMEIDLPLPGEGSGVFRFPREHVVVPQGFRSDWRTVPPTQAGSAPQELP